MAPIIFYSNDYKIEYKYCRNVKEEKIFINWGWLSSSSSDKLGRRRGIDIAVVVKGLLVSICSLLEQLVKNFGLFLWWEYLMTLGRVVRGFRLWNIACKGYCPHKKGAERLVSQHCITRKRARMRAWGSDRSERFRLLRLIIWCCNFTQFM